MARVTADPRTVHIDIEIDNASDHTVAFLLRPPGLEDGHGTYFDHVRDEWATEAEEQRLELDPGEEASATLAFRGVIHPDATELTLILNRRSLRHPSPGIPGFRFDRLPVPRAGDAREPTAGPTTP